MAFLDFLTRRADAEFEVLIPPEMMEGITSGGTIAPRVSRRQALQVPAVLRARNLICSTLGYLPIHVRDKELNIAHPTSLFDQIDPDVPNVVTFSETYEDLLFEGIAWWRVLKSNFQGFPTSATRVHPDRVMVTGGKTFPIVSGDGTGTLQPAGRVFIDGLQVPDDQVIRFDSPNPALLVHAARAIRTSLMLDDTAARYAEEPVPLGAFTPREGLKVREDPKTIAELLDKWESYRRNRVWGYVGAAWELKEMQFNAEQIQLAEQRQHAVLEIARATGLDPEDLGVSTTSRTYQNSEERRRERVDFTMRPYSSAVEQRLSMGDVTPRGFEVKVNFDAFLRSTTKERYEAHKIALDAGFLTIPEIRELEDRPNTIMQRPVPQLDPMPNGDRRMEEVR